MEFKISKEIFEKYPELMVGAVILKGIDNSKPSEKIQEMIKKLIEDKRQQVNPEKVAEIPTIAKWREIYRSFGAKPSDYRNSAEALLKRILKKNLYKINPLVDIYNYISIKQTMTVGGEDLDTMKGDLILDFAKGDEEFIPLGEEENSPPWKGEVVYKDNKGIICRCWNWREGDRTKLTKDTKNTVIVIENLILEDNERLNNALNELKELIIKYCGGEGEIKVLSKDNPSIAL